MKCPYLELYGSSNYFVIFYIDHFISTWLMPFFNYFL